MENYNDANYNDLINVIADLNEKYPRPGIFNLVKLIKGPYYISDPNQLQNNWEDFENPGVYFIFSINHELLYIGMSTTSIGSRLRSSFGSLINPKNPQWLQNEGKAAGYVSIILIGKEHRFEAPAIEDYLICKLKKIL